MKTIEQLLALSKNPYYKFTSQEEQKLNDFLFKRLEKDSKRSAKKSSKKSDSTTRATVTDDEKSHGSDTVKVRNIVEKTIPHVEESLS
jgi:hypothetical protein